MAPLRRIDRGTPSLLSLFITVPKSIVFDEDFIYVEKKQGTSKYPLSSIVKVCRTYSKSNESYYWRIHVLDNKKEIELTFLPVVAYRDSTFEDFLQILKNQHPKVVIKGSTRPHKMLYVIMIGVVGPAVMILVPFVEKYQNAKGPEYVLKQGHYKYYYPAPGHRSESVGVGDTIGLHGEIFTSVKDFYKWNDSTYKQVGACFYRRKNDTIFGNNSPNRKEQWIELIARKNARWTYGGEFDPCARSYKVAAVNAKLKIANRYWRELIKIKANYCDENGKADSSFSYYDKDYGKIAVKYSDGRLWSCDSVGRLQ